MSSEVLIEKRNIAHQHAVRVMVIYKQPAFRRIKPRVVFLLLRCRSIQEAKRSVVYCSKGIVFLLNFQGFVAINFQSHEDLWLIAAFLKHKMKKSPYPIIR